MRNSKQTEQFAIFSSPTANEVTFWGVTGQKLATYQIQVVTGNGSNAPALWMNQTGTNYYFGREGGQGGTGARGDNLSSHARIGTPMRVPDENFIPPITLNLQMPRNARVVAPGIPYHVTQRGTNRQQVFFGIADRKLYLQLIRENLAEAGVRILAYCLMTNHVHFIAVPGREDSLAVLFGRAHGRYSQALNIRRGRCGHLWQARFHSCPMSGAHLQVGLRYVEANPCRAGLVERPEQYRWSSAAAHLLGAKDRSGVLDLGYWERGGGLQTWGKGGQPEQPRENWDTDACPRREFHPPDHTYPADA